MSDYLPDNLWMEIFIKLPIKSILRCIGVCQSWKYLIKNQEFITLHLNSKIENEAHNSCFLVHTCRYSKKERFTFYDEISCPMDILHALKSPFKAQNNFFEIVGTCNGLVCLLDSIHDCFSNIIVWNPLVRKSVYIPRPNFACRNCKFNAHLFGFGYDSIERDYKVVRIICRGNGEKAENYVEIFRLSMHRWENISDRALGRFTLLTNGQIYLNGSLHWIGMVKDTLNNVVRNMVVLFDVCEERFREMEFPKSLVTLSTYRHDMKVVVYKGLLAIVLDDFMKYSIWTMSEYGNVDSWNEQICIHPNLLIRWPGFGFMKNGDIPSIGITRELCSYNPVTMQYSLLRENEVSPYSRDFFYSYITSYLESLVFIDKGAEFSDAATIEELNVANGRAYSHMVRFQYFIVFCLVKI